ncbi:efflux RND transporter periplasmic adaptor subunit [Pseudonocardia xinjiangensis]|uniref:Biotin/lipoyl-binding protein n=1 Tax=Pseudonocardia xinjiangensis TaxID=75289 RepID=A0ABX1R6B5_9PSEU|nr:HlyD family efflux transporter periplasmic adaptor subunit [Pseudonocardia xinjiangensis]NMH75607.1 biotin/lipoyl-binding protein [Pseudonocardia xinjiangensis]
MSRTTRRRTRVTLSVAVLAVVGATACTAEQPPPPTLRVDRGTVATSVSASGTLVAITEQNLGFPQAGKLAEVLVGVGTRVEPGQVLARLDDFALRQTLEQRHAGLAQQQAQLAKIRNGNSVEAAQATLEQAEKILDATEDQAEATNNANYSATDRAEKQLEFDRKVLDQAEHRLEADKRACGSGPPKTTTPPPPVSSQPAPAEKPSSGLLGTGGSQSATADAAPAGSQTGSGGGLVANPACDRIPADKQAVTDAKRVVLSSETALDTAEQRQNVDEAAGRLSIENARQSVVTAKNEVDSAGSDKPADTSAQEAAVRDAEAQVALAQRDVDNTVLRAPVAAVVSAVNGAEGEYVGAATGTTALAPGSSAALPEIAATSGGGAGGGAGAAPGGGAFIVLNNIDSFQLVVPFEESDAARVAANQRVEITVDAVPDLRAPATVLAIAPSGNSTTGVVRYYATIVLTENDDRLRDGQTALADVMVQSVDNVLRAPSAATRTDAGRLVVDVRGPDGAPVPTPFQAGLVGDEYTEVVSGLTEGQELLLPQGQSTT